MEKSLFRFIWKYSSRQQIFILMVTVLTYPVVYFLLELPKLIVNDAVQGDNFPRNVFGFDFDQIPYLVLLAVLAMLFIGSPFEGTLIPLYVAFGLTYWIGPCRVIRGESMKIKELEYVQAATAIGFGRFYILLRHIIPNTSHLMFINFSLLLIAAIKGEVILTFLGLGLKQGASWGIMIRDSAQQVVNDNFWQIGAATFFMFLLVLAFNIFTDALQDAFDPKHVG